MKLFTYPAHSIDTVLVASQEAIDALIKLYNEEHRPYPATYDVHTTLAQAWQGALARDCERLNELWADNFNKETLSAIPLDVLCMARAPFITQDVDDELSLGIALATEEVAGWQRAAILAVYEDLGVTFEHVPYDEARGGVVRKAWLSIVRD